MAKNISLLGADYPDVPAVQLPQTGGGTAMFYDINVVDNLNSDSSTDALSAKQGKVLNEKITGLKMDTVEWYTTFPSTRDMWGSCKISIPCINPENKSVSITRVYLYNASGAITDVTSSCRIDSGISSKSQIVINVPYNANYAGWMIRISLTLS